MADRRILLKKPEKKEVSSLSKVKEYLLFFYGFRLYRCTKGVGSRGNGDPYVPLYQPPKVAPKTATEEK